jgi:hypothetical protein
MLEAVIPPLAPTPLPMGTPHAPWLNTFPKRDNLIKVAVSSECNKHELCSDVFGTLFKWRIGSKSVEE